jgi:hypothetical protein
LVALTIVAIIFNITNWLPIPDFFIYFTIIISIVVMGIDASAGNINKLKLTKMPVTKLERSNTFEWIVGSVLLWAAFVPVYAIKRNKLFELAEKTDEFGKFNDNNEVKNALRKNAAIFTSEEYDEMSARSRKELLLQLSFLVFFGLIIIGAVSIRSEVPEMEKTAVPVVSKILRFNYRTKAKCLKVNIKEKIIDNMWLGEAILNNGSRINVMITRTGGGIEVSVVQ